MTHTHHSLDYVEIAQRDVAAAKQFYSAAFGWAFNDYGPDYAGIRAPDGEGEVGGLNGTSEPSPGGPLVLLWSEDLDATVAAVEAAGGEIVTPPYDFPGGRRFHFADPGGTVLGVWAER
jgi:predicted enzyme related to lactoylglutathione lyase